MLTGDEGWASAVEEHRKALGLSAIDEDEDEETERIKAMQLAYRRLSFNGTPMPATPKIETSPVIAEPKKLEKKTVTNYDLMLMGVKSK